MSALLLAVELARERRDEPTSLTAYCDLDGTNLHTTTWSARKTRGLVASMVSR